MKRFLFVIMPGTGHFNMTVPVARKLTDLGHYVAYASANTMKDKVKDEGFDFFSAGLPNVSEDCIADLLPELRTLCSTELQNIFIERWFYALTPAMTQDILNVLKEYPSDLMFVDSTAFCGALVYELTGIPWASFSAGILWLPSKDLPPFGLGLSPPRTLQEKSVLKTMLALARQRVKAWDTQMNKIRAEFGLKPIEFSSIRLSPQLIIYFITKSFEYPRSDLPRQVHLVGPSIWSKTKRARIPDALRNLPLSKPLIYVTLGTVFHFKIEICRMIIAGLRELDVQVVMTVGQKQNIENFKGVPHNFIIEPYIPQCDIFPYVDLVICHGGYNTTVEALAHGIPVMCIPVSADQFEVSQRVVEAGAGTRIDADKLNPIVMNELIRKMFTYPQYRENALNIKKSFEQHNGPCKAAELLIELAERKKPIYRD